MSLTFNALSNPFLKNNYTRGAAELIQNEVKGAIKEVILGRPSQQCYYKSPLINKFEFTA